MEITFARDALYEAVHAVSGALQEKTPRPALQCIHFDVKSDAVTLSATDLRIAIRRTIEPKSVSETGTGLVHGTRLGGLLRDASTDEVVLKFASGRTELKAGKSVFKLTSQDADQYPQLPAFSKAAVTVNGERFGELVRRSVFAVASEQGRYAIDGVSMTIADGAVEMVGTDGRRLAIANSSIEGSGSIAQCVVPPKMLSELRKLAEAGGSVELALDGGMLLGRARNLLIAGTLIEGTFPKYKEMIPKPSTNVVTVSAQQLSAALRQAEHLTAEDSRAVTFKFAPGNLTLESKSAAVGEASITVDITYDGEPMVAAFNARFILDAINEFAGEDVSIELERPDRPAVIRREGFTYVVAPVRVRENADG
jgi:DNA polymerase-3 subunit beta